MDLHHLAHAIRVLSVSAVQQARSGHLGLPLGMADVATVLFAQHLKFNAQHPKWINRDRFVLSAGHGSMLLYSLLYLTGYEDITLKDIKDFRQLHSKTAGHPEYGHLSGIETTTGPLGQGFANAVGIAIAERMQNAFNPAFGYKTYVIAGDGCLMEGISHEAASLAGHLKLKNLVVLFDNNEVSIDGNTSLTCSDDVIKRFESYGWNTISIDGHNDSEIHNAISISKASNLPTLISCKTTIGIGFKAREKKSSAHGGPYGREEVDNFLNGRAPFEVSDDVLRRWREIGVQHCDNESHDEIDDANTTIPWNEIQIPIKPEATRKSSGNTLECISEYIPNLVGGSADLTGSNNTKASHMNVISSDNFSGSYIYYGVREHAMGAIMNGLALSGFIPYGGTFMAFSDYMRPAIRLAALMKLQVVYIFTHDSIGLGEDGPTHQPVEHLASLRTIPNLCVFRPCDAQETIECWKIALSMKNTPSVLSLTRQNVQQIEKNCDVERGAYMLSEIKNPQVIIYASGSEVEIATSAQKILYSQGINSAVVSVPCMEIFWQQDIEYQKEMLPHDIPRIVIEAASRQSWDRILGQNGKFIGMDSFGASAKAEDLYQYFNITAEIVVSTAKSLLIE